MKIVTWNINGIRASSGKPGAAASSVVHSAGLALKAALDNLEADIICLQETKVTRDQLEESIALVKGYESFFSFSRVKAGYSGVATYCRDQCSPSRAEEGLTPIHQPPGPDAIGCYGELAQWSESEQALVDGEGRAVLTEHRVCPAPECSGSGSGAGNGKAASSVVIVNVYCPRAGMDEVQRYDYKMLFYRALELRCRALREAAKHVIVLGDVNCSHRLIDVCDSDKCTPEEFNNRPSRLWLDSLLIDTHSELTGRLSTAGACSTNTTTTATTSTTAAVDAATADGYHGEHGDSSAASTNGLLVDSFRHYHPARPYAYTCWSTMTGARKTNYGTRIDYVLVDKVFLDSYSTGADIMPEVEGSDHCPVYLNTCCLVSPPAALPSLAASRMPEFSGKQQSLISYLKRAPRRTTALSTASTPTGAARSQDSERCAAPPARASQRQPVVAPVKRAAPPHGSQAPDKKKACSRPQQASISGFFQRKKPAETALATSNTTGEAQQSSSTITCSNVVTRSDADCSSSPVQAQSLPHAATASAAADRTGTQWKNLFTARAPKQALCHGHKEPCVLRTVNKAGPNQFRKFYVCARPAGSKDNPNARCEHFEWIDKPKFKQKQPEKS
ncbi:DNA-(apurinic or apyrimidinic site) endonuclease 2-like [Sycon ciliatum]|uniref:DNA-(apurinic or apyrimidinic site) endonuclease 2-like n=1 Tax=Sycon ciliatum TaxID=27933 RepID=UPI0031F691A3